MLLRAVGCGLDGVGVATSRSTALRRIGVSWSGIRAVGAGKFSRYGRNVGGPLSASLKAALPLLDPLLWGGMLSWDNSVVETQARVLESTQETLSEHA